MTLHFDKQCLLQLKKKHSYFSGYALYFDSNVANSSSVNYFYNYQFFCDL